jgi:hypothetical protein
VSAEGIRVWAQRLEQLGRDGDLAPAPTLLHELKRQVERLRESTATR